MDKFKDMGPYNTGLILQVDSIIDNKKKHSKEHHVNEVVDRLISSSPKQ